MTKDREKTFNASVQSDHYNAETTVICKSASLWLLIIIIRFQTIHEA